MSFDIRLVRLMTLFHISNKELADACNVDPSLVSRWRSGQRFPSEKYNQIQQIASFFLGLEINDLQKAALDDIIALQKLYTPLLDRQIDLLTSWLADRRYSPLDEKNISTDHRPYFSNSNNTGMTDYIQNEKVIPQPHLSLSLQNKREFHIYYGNSGKRKAAMLFLQKALSIDNPTDIYIFSDELLAWWLEDQLFQDRWTSYMELIVMKKHRIHLIHDVNRQKEEFAMYMNIWLPMHLIGSINSYYLPIYAKNSVKETYMVIKGHMALESRSTFLTPKENICFLFEDSDTVDMIESLFLGRLVQCKPLIHVYKEQDQSHLLKLYLKSITNDYNVIAFHNCINSIFLPDSVFERHCENWIHSKKNEYMQFVKQWKTIQFIGFNKRTFVDIFSFETLQKMINSETYDHYDPILFANNVISVTRKEIIIALNTMLFALQRYPRFDIYFTKKETLDREFNLNIEYREFHSALFTTNYQQALSYIGLYANEGNLMQSFGYHLNNTIKRMPDSYKNKDEIIKQLNYILQKINP